MAAAAPFLAKAAPYIATGVQSLLGYKAAKQGSQQTPEQTALMGAQTEQAQQQTSLSKTLQGQSQKQYNLSAPAYGKAVSYYSTLLGGDRAAQAQAVAAPTANIQETYSGAERNLERMGVRGGEAATAKADLNRQQAGQIAGLTAGTQGGAAEKLGGLGMQGMYGSMTGAQAAVGAGSSAASIYGNLLGTSYGRSDIGYDRSKDIGSSLMSTIMPWLQALQKKYGAGGGAGGGFSWGSGGGTGGPG